MLKSLWVTIYLFSIILKCITKNILIIYFLFLIKTLKKRFITKKNIICHFPLNSLELNQVFYHFKFIIVLNILTFFFILIF